jgi:glycosyltransferase involved in cell wall biosynthesis
MKHSNNFLRKDDMPQKVLFLIPYPLNEAPSQRFRFEQYFQFLESNNYVYKVQSFLNSRNWHLFFKDGNVLRKCLALINGFLNRFLILLEARKYNFVFIHREATPLGPPVIEWILAHILRCNIIYDFDDAIWLTDRKQESWFLKHVKYRSKVKLICKWAYRVSCGNMYLCDYAKQFSVNVIYNPTTIDTENRHNKDLFTINKNPNTVTIGWTGSHSTLKYLQEVEPVLKQIEKQYPYVNFIAIADRPPDINLTSVQYITWNEETEIEDLLKIDIGIMPLPEDEWAKGKCGFKALQYMALNIPAVVSAVGVNVTIIDHGVNGFLAKSQEEWFDFLQQLITDDNLRKKIGTLGRKKVIECYSVISNKSSFLSLFE